MNKPKALLYGVMLVVGVMLVAGCQSAQQRANVQQIPQITKLAEKATATPRVHRFRKPLRDERDRTLRQLAVECERLASSYRGEGVSAEALTGSVPEPSQTASVDLQSLETALARLAAAARSGDVRAIRSSHSAALTAYARAQSRTAPPAP